jgi:hypothetical protein
LVAIGQPRRLRRPDRRLAGCSDQRDILFYGCDFAGSHDGKLLIESLSALTGADVAASIDDTGHAIFGGDWDLEYKAGEIQSSVAFSVNVQASWLGLLATIGPISDTDATADEVSESAANGTTVGITAFGWLIYTDRGDASRFPAGAQGVIVAGNVLPGRASGVAEGSIGGKGLSDLIDVSWGGDHRDARHSQDSPFIGQADKRFAVALRTRTRGYMVNSSDWRRRPCRSTFTNDGSCPT